MKTKLVALFAFAFAIVGPAGAENAAQPEISK